MKRTLGGLIAMLVVLSACTDEGATKKKPADPLKRDAAVVKPAWTVDLDPIGQPVVTGTTAVVIAKESGKRLSIVGVDTTSGKQIWDHPMSPNNALTGYAIKPQLSKTAAGKEVVIFFLAPKKPEKGEGFDITAPIAAVDPATGKIIAKSETVTTNAPIQHCADGKDVCLDGYRPGDQYSNLRFDLDKQKFGPDSAGAPSSARFIGADGLFSTDSRPGEQIGVARKGEKLWSKPIGALTGEGYSSDGGWSLVHETGPDRYTGQFGVAPTEEQLAGKAKSRTIDLAEQVLTSFSGKDGSVLWMKKGVQACFEPTDFDDEEALIEVKAPIRCTASGTTTYVEEEDPVHKDVAMTIEGYQPGTGKKTWTHALPPAAALAYQNGEGRIVIKGSSKIVANLKSGPTLIDTSDGKTAAAKKQIFMCQTDDVRFPYIVPRTQGEQRITERFGTGLLYACSPDGKPATSGMTKAALQEGALRAGESTFVIAAETGLVGYSS